MQNDRQRILTALFVAFAVTVFTIGVLDIYTIVSTATHAPAPSPPPTPSGPDLPFTPRA